MHKDSQNRAVFWVRCLLIAVGTSLVFVLGSALFGTEIVRTQLEKWRLVSVPERYTELYFNRDLSLPTSTDDSSANFNFTIHNMEGRPMVYTYTVAIRPLGEGARVNSQDTVAVPAGESRSVSQRVTVPATAADTEVIVTLLNQQQEIHFWLRKPQ